jgi:hypothetical protein
VPSVIRVSFLCLCDTWLLLVFLSVCYFFPYLSRGGINVSAPDDAGVALFLFLRPCNFGVLFLIDPSCFRYVGSS